MIEVKRDMILAAAELQRCALVDTEKWAAAQAVAEVLQEVVKHITIEKRQEEDGRIVTYTLSLRLAPDPRVTEGEPAHLIGPHGESWLSLVTDMLDRGARTQIVLNPIPERERA